MVSPLYLSSLNVYHALSYSMQQSHESLNSPNSSYHGIFENIISSIWKDLPALSLPNSLLESFKYHSEKPSCSSSPQSQNSEILLHSTLLQVHFIRLYNYMINIYTLHETESSMNEGKVTLLFHNCVSRASRGVGTY